MGLSHEAENHGKTEVSLSFPVVSATIEAAVEKYPQGDSNPLPFPSKGELTKELTTVPESSLAHTLACEHEKDPALALVIKEWATLPNHFKAGILAMIDAANRQSERPR
jgi:hypothetical protein